MRYCLWQVVFAILLVQNNTWTGIAIAGVLFFTGFNFLEAKMPAMVSSISPAGSKGSAMGIYASHQFLGAFLGGLLSGLLNSYFSPEYTFMMCLVVIFLLSLIAKGLTSTEQIKRVTIKLESNHINHHDLIGLRDQINNLSGVKEVVADASENAMYLKVDAKTFDMTKAQALIKAQY